MYKYKLLFSALILIFFLVKVKPLGISIDSSNLVKYTYDYKFIDGIYVNFEQVNINQPIEKSKILTSVDYNNPDFFDLILSKKYISYFDNLGVKQTLVTKNIWVMLVMVCYISI